MSSNFIVSDDSYKNSARSGQRKRVGTNPTEPSGPRNGPRFTVTDDTFLDNTARTIRKVKRRAPATGDTMGQQPDGGRDKGTLKVVHDKVTGSNTLRGSGRPSAPSGNRDKNIPRGAKDTRAKSSRAPPA